MMNYFSISSRVLVEEAKLLGLDVDILSEEKNLFVVSSSSKSMLFKSTDFGVNSSLGYKIANDKSLTQMILERGNFPHIKTMYVSQDDTIEDIGKRVSDFSWPLVIKPLDGAHGDGVVTDIQSQGELEDYLVLGRQKYGTMIIQEQVYGEETRIILLDGQLINAYTRIPAHVVGDGVSSIQDLIDAENTTNSLRGLGYEKPYSHLPCDDEVITFLAKNGLTLSSVIGVGEEIFLLGRSNVGSGGIQLSRSDCVPQSIVSTYADLARDAGLRFVGLDVMVNNWDATDAWDFGPILELNATSGIGGDREVTSVNTGKKILKLLFNV